MRYPATEVMVKALTLWQPWASLIAFGEKKVETRCWSTKFRGLLAIHAAAKTPNWLGSSRFNDDFDRCLRTCHKRHNWGPFGWPGAANVAGCVLCIVKLVDVLPTHQVREDLSDQERIFGNYELGRFAWFLQLEERFVAPIQAKGNRLLWNWGSEEQVVPSAWAFPAR